jgi:hypothetical protein
MRSTSPPPVTPSVGRNFSRKCRNDTQVEVEHYPNLGILQDFTVKSSYLCVDVRSISTDPYFSKDDKQIALLF